MTEIRGHCKQKTHTNTHMHAQNAHKCKLQQLPLFISQHHHDLEPSVCQETHTHIHTQITTAAEEDYELLDLVRVVDTIITNNHTRR